MEAQNHRHPSAAGTDAAAAAQPPVPETVVVPEEQPAAADAQPRASRDVKDAQTAAPGVSAAGDGGNAVTGDAGGAAAGAAAVESRSGGEEMQAAERLVTAAPGGMAGKNQAAAVHCGTAAENPAAAKPAAAAENGNAGTGQAAAAPDGTAAVPGAAAGTASADTRGAAAPGSAEPEGTDDSQAQARFLEQAERYARKYAGPARPGFVVSPKVRRGIRIASICSVLFAAYYAYNAFWGPSEERLSFQDLQLRLPLKIDEHTVLESAEENSEGMVLRIVKEAEAFRGLDEARVQEGLDRIASNARRLCSNGMFHRMIAAGKSVTVQLEVTGGIPGRTVVLDSCPLPEASGAEQQH